MFVTDWQYTHENADVVGSLIKHMIEHREDERFFELEVDQKLPNGSSEPTTETILIQLHPSYEPRGEDNEIAGGTEIVRCITKEGKKLDILFGPQRDQRQLEPALIARES